MRSKYLLTAILFIAINGCAQDKTKDKKEDYSDDWAALYHYEKENQTIPAPADGEKRVVFLGSSIFEFWKELAPEYFANPAYLDRGISGQISPQLLLRFRQDVIGLNPGAVIILAGSNDLSGDKGHVTIARIMNNIITMAELARLHHIRPILCEYLPIYEYPWNKGSRPANQIIELNKQIRAYALVNKFTVLDYFSPFKDERNGQKKELTRDGVHPNKAGYEIMAGVTEKAIAEAFSKPAP